MAAFCKLHKLSTKKFAHCLMVVLERLKTTPVFSGVNCGQAGNQTSANKVRQKSRAWTINYHVLPLQTTGNASTGKFCHFPDLLSGKIGFWQEYCRCVKTNWRDHGNVISRGIFCLDFSCWVVVLLCVPVHWIGIQDHDKSYCVIHSDTVRCTVHIICLQFNYCSCQIKGQ